MSTNNICFYRGIRKIIPELSPNTPQQVLWFIAMDMCCLFFHPRSVFHKKTYVVGTHYKLHNKKDPLHIHILWLLIKIAYVRCVLNKYPLHISHCMTKPTIKTSVTSKDSDQPQLASQQDPSLNSHRRQMHSVKNLIRLHG